MINYELTVVTGDEMFAGTNAKVFIQIYGDKGKTEVIKLDSRSNNFERRSTDIFKVTYANLCLKKKKKQEVKAVVGSNQAQIFH